jgi:hypothetical protein
MLDYIGGIMNRTDIDKVITDKCGVSGLVFACLPVPKRFGNTSDEPIDQLYSCTISIEIVQSIEFELEKKTCLYPHVSDFFLNKIY